MTVLRWNPGDGDEPFLMFHGAILDGDRLKGLAKVSQRYREQKLALVDGELNTGFGYVVDQDFRRFTETLERLLRGLSGPMGWR